MSAIKKNSVFTDIRTHYWIDKKKKKKFMPICCDCQEAHFDVGCTVLWL